MSTDLEQRLREALHEDAARARLVNPLGPSAPGARPLTVDQDRRPSSLRIAAVAAAIAFIAAASVVVVRQREPRLTIGDVGQAEDQAGADAAVLTPDDMPFGWDAAPPSIEEHWSTQRDELDQAFADCLEIDVAALQNDSPTAASVFVNSYEPNDELVAAQVTVFPSVTDAGESIDRLRDAAAQRCYLDSVGQQIADGARGGITMPSGRTLSGNDIEIGESTIEEVFLEYVEAGNYKQIGRDARSFRLKVPLVSEGVEADVYVVAGFVREGRALVEMSFQTYFSPFDAAGSTVHELTGTVAQLTKKVVDRIGPASFDPDDIVDQPAEPAPELPALPEPGEQPADPASAEEEVRVAYAGLYDASVPREDRAQFVDRPDVWLPLNQALFESEYGQVLRYLHAVVDAVVFTDPTHASVRFQLLASDPRVPGDYVIGDALLLDGRWVVDVRTPCSTAEATGFTCDFTP